MHRTITVAAVAGAVASVIAGAAVATVVSTDPIAQAGTRFAPAAVHAARHTCAPARTGHDSCAAIVRLNKSGHPAAGTAPGGFSPADIQSAYHLAGATASGRTVAIIDAYHDPSAARDLAQYRATFGLPACQPSTGCFRQVNQKGSSTALPPVDAGWATEISLDLDMVSAACPSCHILLVEANSDSARDLASAVNYAATQQVAAISNSYGGPDTAETAAYRHPGIAITASTGDNGYGVSSPASYDDVIAVGGTTLGKAANARGWNESAWSGAGSGCSTKNPKPAWQGAATRCRGKAIADVAAVADPYTGVAVYDSTPFQGATGWQVYGGTSAAAPIVAAIATLAGGVHANLPSFIWGHKSALNDVTSGSNGSCVAQVLCQAGKGWDGPTGLGTPNGTSAF